MSVICLNCEGWGCAQCKSERQAAQGGEQGLSPLEVELAELRPEAAMNRQTLSHARQSIADERDLARSWFASATELRADRDAWQKRALRAEDDLTLLTAEISLFRGGSA